MQDNISKDNMNNDYCQRNISIFLSKIVFIVSVILLSTTSNMFCTRHVAHYWNLNVCKGKNVMFLLYFKYISLKVYKNKVKDMVKEFCYIWSMVKWFSRFEQTIYSMTTLLILISFSLFLSPSHETYFYFIYVCVCVVYSLDELQVYFFTRMIFQYIK